MRGSRSLRQTHVLLNVEGGRDMCVQVRRKGGGAVVVGEEFRDCPPADSATTAPNRAHFEDDFSSATHPPSTDPSEIAIMGGGGGGMSMGICGFISLSWNARRPEKKRDQTLRLREWTGAE